MHEIHNEEGAVAFFVCPPEGGLGSSWLKVAFSWIATSSSSQQQRQQRPPPRHGKLKQWNSCWALLRLSRSAVAILGPTSQPTAQRAHLLGHLRPSSRTVCASASSVLNFWALAAHHPARSLRDRPACSHAALCTGQPYPFPGLLPRGTEFHSPPLLPAHRKAPTYLGLAAGLAEH
jgi:hypothetical protein